MSLPFSPTPHTRGFIPLQMSLDHFHPSLPTHSSSPSLPLFLSLSPSPSSPHPSPPFPFPFSRYLKISVWRQMKRETYTRCSVVHTCKNYCLYMTLCVPEATRSPYPSSTRPGTPRPTTTDTWSGARARVQSTGLWDCTSQPMNHWWGHCMLDPAIKVTLCKGHFPMQPTCVYIVAIHFCLWRRTTSL